MDVWFGSSNNTIYGNNFEENKFGQISLSQESGAGNFLDNGTQGNYWSNYPGKGTYVIDENNVDYHLLTQQANISFAAPAPFSTILPIAAIAVVVARALAVAFLLLYRRRSNKQTIESKTSRNRSEIEMGLRKKFRALKIGARSRLIIRRQK